MLIYFFLCTVSKKKYPDPSVVNYQDLANASLLNSLKMLLSPNACGFFYRGSSREWDRDYWWKHVLTKKWKSHELGHRWPISLGLAFVRQWLSFVLHYQAISPYSIHDLKEPTSGTGLNQIVQEMLSNRRKIFRQITTSCNMTELFW